MPRNLTAQIHYEAAGNPMSSRPVTAVANCCPGLEFDFRAVWRRIFKGLVLREWDSLVVEIDDDCPPDKRYLKGHRLLRIHLPGQKSDEERNQGGDGDHRPGFIRSEERGQAHAPT